MQPTTHPAGTDPITGPVPGVLARLRARWLTPDTKALLRAALRGTARRVFNLSLAVAIFIACWTALAYYLQNYHFADRKLPYTIMPYAWDVWPVFVSELRDGELWQHTLASAERVLKAIFYAVLVATPVGMGLGQIKQLNRIFSPLIGLAHPIPKIVFLPIILAVLGIGEDSKVFLIALILFFQILVVVRDEAAGLRPELIQSVRSLGAGRRALFRYVYLPASLPAVLTALRVSVGTAVAVLFIAEQYSTKEGLGYYIVTLTWQRIRFEQMYAGILAMSLMGLALYTVVDVLERVVGRWRRAGEL
ncbi:MAG: ABC transporter permease [Chloroflexi bacterium]|nr:ABC transporter permease [Chloroflexota bacterium]